MADELGQVRMQLQMEQEALQRARTQRAADRSASGFCSLIALASISTANSSASQCISIVGT